MDIGDEGGVFGLFQEPAGLAQVRWFRGSELVVGWLAGGFSLFLLECFLFWTQNFFFYF